LGARKRKASQESRHFIDPIAFAQRLLSESRQLYFPAPR